MGSYICPITGLPIEHGEPVVALLLNATTTRVSRTPNYDAKSAWAPRTLPVSGICDMVDGVRFDPSPWLDLWVEGLRLDASPRPAAEHQHGAIGRRTGLDDFLKAARCGHLTARMIDNVGLPGVDPRTPTRPRVRAMLEDVCRETGTRVSWHWGKGCVFPLVDVELFAPNAQPGDADNFVEAFVRRASARQWHVWGRERSDCMNRRRMIVGPDNTNDAVCREAERREGRDASGPRPVGLGVYSRLGWNAMLATPASGFREYTTDLYRERIERARAEWNHPFREETAALYVDEIVARHGSRSRVERDALRLDYLWSTMPVCVFDELFRQGVVGLPWVCGRLFDLGRAGAWDESVVEKALAALAELLAVDQALSVQGRAWSLGSCHADTGQRVSMKDWHAVSVQVEQEARRRVARDSE